jgi:hypothetical protein
MFIVLNKESICEMWQARKDLVIPPGTKAYHLQSKRTYLPGDSLARNDATGWLIICRDPIHVQFRGLRIMASRGDTGAVAYVVWCSLGLGVNNFEQLSANLDAHTPALRFDDVKKSLRSSLAKSLQGCEEYDLTAPQGRRAAEAKVPRQMAPLPGLKVYECILRTVLTQEGYLKEKIVWAEFKRALQKIKNDRKIWETAEENRLEQALAVIENDRVLALLTAEERKLDAQDRFKRYSELFEVTRRALKDIRGIRDAGEKSVSLQKEMLEELRGIKHKIAPPSEVSPRQTLPVRSGKEPGGRREENVAYLEDMFRELEEMQYRELKETLDELERLQVTGRTE